MRYPKRRAPRAAAWGTTAIGLASAPTWLPTMQYDDLAYHLGLPWQLAVHGRHDLAVEHQVWALAPWAGDVLQAIPQVMAGAESRGPVNLLWLSVMAGAAWQLARLLGASAAFRWASAALVATLPMVAALLAGMQTELPASAILAVLACAALERDPPHRAGVALGAVVGLLCGLKLLHPVSAVVLIALTTWRWRHRLARPREMVAAAVTCLAVGGSSYAYAAWVTGNPVLPLLNDVFRSSAFAPVRFADGRWVTDAPLALPWDVTFATSKYLEGWDGGFGFALVALAGAALVAVVRRETRAVALAGLAAIAVAFAALPYARYALPGLALLVPVAVRTVEVVLTRPAAIGLLAALCVSHLAFAANSNWILRTGGIKRSLAAGGRDEPLLARYAAERIVAARIRAGHPAARLLDLHGATHAELAGAGRTARWYAPRMQAAAAAADLDPTGHAWAALLRREGITDVVLRPAALSRPRAAGLARLRAYPALTIDEVEWRRIPAQEAR